MSAAARSSPRSGDAARYGVLLSSDPYESRAIDDVRRLQDNLPALLSGAGLAGAHGVVTGATAVASDTIQAVVDDLWRIALVALAADFLLLAIFLRAVVAPIYLLAASVLTFAATLGLTTYFFQGVLGWSGITYYVPFAVGRAPHLAGLGLQRLRHGADLERGQDTTAARGDRRGQPEGRARGHGRRDRPRR